EFSRSTNRGQRNVSLARGGKDIRGVRIKFYGAAARLRFHTAKTPSSHLLKRGSDSTCAVFTRWSAHIWQKPETYRGSGRRLSHKTANDSRSVRPRYTIRTIFRL